MKILVVGAGGLVGATAVAALRDRHEVIEASRSGTVAVDLTVPASVTRMFEQVGVLDAVIACTGSVPFKPLDELTGDDFRAGFEDKVLGQVNLVQLGVGHVRDGGSFTLTSGVLAREPVQSGVVGSMANGALEAFVMAAAAELPRGLRINAVSPTVMEENVADHDLLPGFSKVSSRDLGQAFVKSVEGIQTGRIYELD